jgi:hypothetical protein
MLRALIGIPTRMTSLDLPAAGTAARAGEQRSLRLRLLCVLFFFSGFRR